MANLRKIIDELYEKSSIKPTLVAPGGFYEQKWFTDLLQITGSGVVNIVTHHLYNLGAGRLRWYPSVSVYVLKIYNCPSKMYRLTYILFVAFSLGGAQFCFNLK